MLYFFVILSFLLFCQKLLLCGEFQDKMVGKKMVRTKWYEQNGIQPKWYWTKWYGQCGTDKMVQIKYISDKIINHSINPASIDNMIFFFNPASNLTPLAFICVFFIYLCLLITKYILN